MKLRERYILWRLTPAEQLIYRMLKCPEEWEDRGAYCIRHKRSGLELWVGESGSRARVFSIHEFPGAQGFKPGYFARSTLHSMAHRIKYPPPPTTKELQRRLFQYLMKCELGEQK